MTHIHRETVRRDYESFAVYILEGFPAHRHNSKSLRWFVNGIRNQIWELAEIYTGYCSQEAVDYNQYTSEHIFPRQKSAELIINALLNGKNFSVKRLTALLMSRSRVHYVTSDENRRLIPAQKFDSYRWRSAYRENNIELVLDGNTHRKNKQRSFIVDGLRYETYHDVIEHYSDLVYSQVYYRCNSTSKKWSGWCFAEC